jgi:hypothetical protein
MSSYFLFAMDGAFSIYVESHGELSVITVNMYTIKKSFFFRKMPDTGRCIHFDVKISTFVNSYVYSAFSANPCLIQNGSQ